MLTGRSDQVVLAEPLEAATDGPALVQLVDEVVSHAELLVALGAGRFAQVAGGAAVVALPSVGQAVSHFPLQQERLQHFRVGGVTAADVVGTRRPIPAQRVELTIGIRVNASPRHGVGETQPFGQLEVHSGQHAEITELVVEAGVVTRGNTHEEGDVVVPSQFTQRAGVRGRLVVVEVGVRQEQRVRCFAGFVTDDGVELAEFHGPAVDRQLGVELRNGKTVAIAAGFPVTIDETATLVGLHGASICTEHGVSAEPPIETAAVVFRFTLREQPNLLNVPAVVLAATQWVAVFNGRVVAVLVAEGTGLKPAADFRARFSGLEFGHFRGLHRRLSGLGNGLNRLSRSRLSKLGLSRSWLGRRWCRSGSCRRLSRGVLRRHHDEFRVVRACKARGGRKVRVRGGTC